ncbi:MAG: OmpA family protein [Polyangiales bacterium]
MRFAPAILALTLCLAPSSAMAQWQAHGDLGLAVPAGPWQGQSFGLGLAASAGVTAQLGALADLALNLGAVTVSSRDEAVQGVPTRDAGGAAWLALGVRLRPLPRRPDGAARLWIEGSVGGALTGPVVVPAVRAAIGWSFPLGPTEFGPALSWLYLPQTDDLALPGDAHVVSLGVRISLPRNAIHAPPPPLPPPPPPPPPEPRCPASDGAPTVADVNGDGCPDPDRDGDGVADLRDRCPDEPEDRDGFEDEDGCPDPDNDRDEIPDARDRCPNEPEVVNGVDDDDGCPDEGLVELRQGQIVVQERVFFDTDSYRIRARSEAALDAVATLLRRLPPRQPVTIEGHADQRGDDRYNHLLSLLRAGAVQRELVSRGLLLSRFRILGFGRTSPLREGHSPEDLAANRRVQIIVSGVGSVGVAQVPGGWVRVTSDGERHSIPEPPR